MYYYDCILSRGILLRGRILCYPLRVVWRRMLGLSEEGYSELLYDRLYILR
jgi:hypothetical protein